jgi:hypothetical protein
MKTIISSATLLLFTYLLFHALVFVYPKGIGIQKISDYGIRSTAGRSAINNSPASNEQLEIEIKNADRDMKYQKFVRFNEWFSGAAYTASMRAHSFFLENRVMPRSMTDMFPEENPDPNIIVSGEDGVFTLRNGEDWVTLQFAPSRRHPMEITTICSFSVDLTTVGVGQPYYTDRYLQVCDEVDNSNHQQRAKTR